MIGRIVESLIFEVTKVMPCFSQLPLAEKPYPFAVLEETITSTRRPRFSVNIIVDIWDNKLNETYVDLDTLAKDLYDIVVIKEKFFYQGKWEVVQNVPTMEEGLTRKQIRLELTGWNLML